MKLQLKLQLYPVIYRETKSFFIDQTGSRETEYQYNSTVVYFK